MAKCLRLHILCIIIIRVLITFGGPISYSLPDEGVHTDADTLLAVNWQLQFDFYQFMVAHGGVAKFKNMPIFCTIIRHVLTKFGGPSTYSH